MLALVGCSSEASGPMDGGASLDAARSDGASPAADAPTAGSDGSTATDSSTALDSAILPSSGCGTAASPGTTLRHVTVGGVDRTFTVVIPDAYDPAVPHSLILRFHGWGATGAEAVGGVSGLAVPPIIVGPDTDPPTGTAVSWDTSGDLAFVDAMVDTLTRELCIDAGRNFATGYSNGGFMAHAVGCHRSSTFRGVAIMESGSGGAGCDPVAIYIQHNSDDTTVPISYGTTLRDQSLATNGCTMTSHAVMPAPCVAYDGCSAGHPVIWCNPATGGHRPDYSVALGIGPFFESL